MEEYDPQETHWFLKSSCWKKSKQVKEEVIQIYSYQPSSLAQS